LLFCLGKTLVIHYQNAPDLLGHHFHLIFPAQVLGDLEGKLPGVDGLGNVTKCAGGQGFGGILQEERIGYEGKDKAKP
jgi:hypothetical protein